MNLAAFNLPLFDMTFCIVRVADMMNPAIGRHQRRVGYIVHRLARQLALDTEATGQVQIAALLHDVGALVLAQSKDHLTHKGKDPSHSAQKGHALLKQCLPLARAAEIIRHHDVRWEDREAYQQRGLSVDPLSHLIALAESIDILLPEELTTLEQIEEVKAMVRSGHGTRFCPDHCEAFLAICHTREFWLDLKSPQLPLLLADIDTCYTPRLNLSEMSHLTEVIRQLIRSRCPFTAAHSAGVAAVATALAKKVGMKHSQQRLMHIAGQLHDLGKLCLPRHLIEKEADLSAEERWQVKEHPYHSYRLLQDVGLPSEFNAWISYHHERINGSGYPFGLKKAQLPLGARVMAIADVVTALTEARPYRDGLSERKALELIELETLAGGLDPEVVDLLREDYDAILHLRRAAQHHT